MRGRQLDLLEVGQKSPGITSGKEEESFHIRDAAAHRKYNITQHIAQIIHTGKKANALKERAAQHEEFEFTLFAKSNRSQNESNQGKESHSENRHIDAVTKAVVQANRHKKTITGGEYD